MTDTPAVHGIHHVTAIAGDPQENLSFYAGTLGMRLVKKSVNQDDPGTYHLFYADAAGSPGTDLTFFPWPGMAPARAGTGKVAEVQLAIPSGTLDWWSARLAAAGVPVMEAETRFGDRALPFRDPHGLVLAFVEVEERAFEPWTASPVPAERQVRGLHAVRLRARAAGPTERLLTETMGFDLVGEEGPWRQFAAGEGSGAYAELREEPDAPAGRWGTGGVHHVAWRVADEEEELAVRSAVQATGLSPTPVIDRFWFQSVYFTEPGGTLFELATDGPGFDRDEDPAHLGETLVLPPWLEPHRREIESALPALEVPAST